MAELQYRIIPMAGENINDLVAGGPTNKYYSNRSREKESGKGKILSVGREESRSLH